MIRAAQRTPPGGRKSDLSLLHRVLKSAAKSLQEVPRNRHDAVVTTAATHAALSDHAVVAPRLILSPPTTAPPSDTSDS